VKNIFFLFLALSLIFSSCEKRRVRNKLEGTWRVKTYLRDTANMLLRIDSVPIFSSVCDTVLTEYRRSYEYSYTFGRDGTINRRTLATHRFSNASLFDASCTPAYSTMAYDSLLEGKWQYAEGGNLAIQFPGLLDNVVMKFNNDREMDWEQVIQIDTGIVKFSGVEKWLLIKQ